MNEKIEEYNVAKRSIIDNLREQFNENLVKDNIENISSIFK